MNERLEQWFENEVDRETALKRQQIETAKLVATVAIAAAAAFVATELQVERNRNFAIWGSLLIGLAFLGLVVAMACDRMHLADLDAASSQYRVGKFTDDQLVIELREHLQAANRYNEDVVRWVRNAAAMTVALAAAAAIVAILGSLTVGGS